MERSCLEESVAALERENRIIRRKLKRSETNRALMEEALESHLHVVKVCANNGNDHRALIAGLRAEIEEEYRAKARADEQLRRQDLLNLVGETAANIGHGVRNPLTTVRGYLQYFGAKDGFKKYKDALWLMIAELDRANEIIAGYLPLAQNKRVDLQPGNLEQLLRKLKPLLQVEAIRHGHTLEYELQDTPAILMDGDEIGQLVVHLVKNGLEAMGDTGRITVRTAFTGDGALLTVEDSGKGIPPEALDKLGMPFFSTKPGGNGLGLAVSCRTVERHGGTISFASSPAGTKVSICFPVVAPVM